MVASADFEGTVAIDLLAILATAAVAALLMQRLRMAVIPAYLLTGVLVGPHALGLVSSPANLQAISHLAILLLLFGIGLQLHLSALKHGFMRMVAIGLSACVLCVFVGWPVALAFRLAPPTALTVSMGLALSSTAVVLRILTDRREVHRVSGRLALAILVVQDLMVLALLVSLPALAKWAQHDATVLAGAAAPPPPVAWRELLVEEGLRLAGVAALVLVGKVLLPWLVRESLRARSLEVMIVVSIAGALGTAVCAQALGTSLEMGAFLAGFLLARTPFRFQIAGQIGPLRDLLIAVFFTTVGMKLDPVVVGQWWWLILLATVVMMAVKGLLIAATCWSFGATAATALCVGVYLSQAGEFSLVLLDGAYTHRLVSDSVLGVCIAVVVISLMLTPALIQWGSRFTRSQGLFVTVPWIRTPPFREGSATTAGVLEPQPRAIVAGYGPIGRRVTEALQRAGVRCTVIELNPATVRQESRAGQAILFGDVAN
ncbi:MAG: cation:proton antiporter, partial [Planctomycetota bacterium]